jgi:hypothetical protein
MSTTTREFILEALKRYAPISTPHLAQKLNMLPATVGWQIEKLHTERRIYVHSYSQQKSKTHTRIWAIGDQEDAKRGEKFNRHEYYYGDEYDQAEEKRRAEALKKGHLTEEQIEAMNAAREEKRRKELAARIRPFRDEMIWALFGGQAA